MNRIITTLVATLAAGATVIGAASPSFAAEPWMRGNRGGVAGHSRDHGGHYRHQNRGHRSYRHGRDYDRHRHHGNSGAAAAFGLAAGVIAGAAANSGSHSSCAARFKSYNPRTHTYLGYDGHRHVCR